MGTLTGVVVHWGRVEPLVELVEAWPVGVELVVVDNGGHGGLPEGVRGRARVVEGRGNLGFGGGANAGVEAARGEWVLVMNPDVRPEAGAVERLVAALEGSGAAGGVPRLVGGDGAGQEGWQLRGLPRLGHLLLQALQVPAAPRVAAVAGGAVEQPAAAALALRREVFRGVGGFDERFHPAWFEDVDLAARLAAAGHRVVWLPEAVFRHRQGDSVGQLGYGRFLWTYQRNLARYAAKHHGRLAAAAVRLLLPVGIVARALLLPVRRPRRAPRTADALRGLGQALAGALSSWRLPAAWAERTPARAGGAR